MPGLDCNPPNLTVLWRLHLVDEVLMSASAVLSVSPLSPEAEADFTQTEVAGDDTLTLHQRSGSHRPGII